VRAAGDQAHVTIDVVDNGPGVPPEESAVIFEKFQRGSAAAESGAVGTGLGLAVVKAIVAAHRGKVEVRAAASRGARFRIVLPRARLGTT
jgi:signal transduction histidine kinase